MSKTATTFRAGDAVDGVCMICGQHQSAHGADHTCPVGHTVDCAEFGCADWTHVTPQQQAKMQIEALNDHAEAMRVLLEQTIALSDPDSISGTALGWQARASLIDAQTALVGVRKGIRRAGEDA